MALPGSAAMVLGFDSAPEAINENDDWYTHEHFAERLSIPGCNRASRRAAPPVSTGWVPLSPKRNRATEVRFGPQGSMPNPSSAIAGFAPLIKSATMRALPSARVQPSAPWPQLRNRLA